MSPHLRATLPSQWLVMAFLCAPILFGFTGCHGNSSSIPNINNAAAFLEDNAVYQGPSMVSPRYGHTGTTLEDGTVLIIGGSDERHLTSIDAAEIFDQGASVDINDPIPPTISGDFIDTDVEGNLMLLTQGGRIFHTSTLLPDGNVFVCGGTNDALFAQAIETSEIFDISTREFAPDDLQLLDDINVPRFRHSATLLPNGKVLVAGGQESRSETIIDPNFAPGQPGFQVDINVFPSLKTMEVFDPGSRSFQAAVSVNGTDAEFLSARGRAGHNTGTMAGIDNAIGTTDDILLHAGGFQTLSTIFAPQFKLPWQQDTSNSQNFEYFDATTNDNRIAAGIVAADRVNHPILMNLGTVRDSTLAFDLDEDGIIDPQLGDIPSIPGVTNILLISNGDNDDPACPTGSGQNDLLVATFTGFGPSNGLTFTLFGGGVLTNNIELIVFDPMNCIPFSRSEADMVMVQTRRTYNGQTITTGVGLTAGGSFMIPTPNGCVELLAGTCANDIAGVTIYDPFYYAGNDPPWDQTVNINPITHPTGVAGTFINVDGLIASGDIVDAENGWAEGTFLMQLAQPKMLHTLNVIPGEDGVMNTVDDRVVSVGGGTSYFPNYGDEPATLSCDVILLPGTNEPPPAGP